MRPSFKAVLAALALLLSLVGVASAQAGRRPQQQAPEAKKKSEQTTTTAPAEQKGEQPPQQEEEAPPAGDQQDVETVRVETNLVTVPVIVSDRGDIYLPDLKQEDFAVFEDGVKQEVSFFETVTAPFHVLLMIDTSASTQEKLGMIQRAAIAFTEQLQQADRVKVISFDNSVRDLCNFTSDRAVLQWAIRDTRPGTGTKLYDAMNAGIKAFRGVKGRKAIVIFTDGVDSYSDRETYNKNVRLLEEAGIIVYPIRYDTRADVEELVRRQQQQGQIVDLGTILGSKLPGGGGSGRTTPTTFPGGTTVPSGGGVGTTFPRLPGGVVVTRTRRDNRNDPYPPGDPRNNDPTVIDPSGTRRNDPTYPSGTANDNISRELDMMYKTADAYLAELAEKSGGRLHRADTLGSLPRAFGQIAAELRTQYSLGYYPQKPERDGKYRKIKVTTTRKGAVVRARPGYRAPNGAK
ncbi:MAG TPA: VWA domain-containing protein [Pyrinomonadaceae bacterium]|nr:VWA domain-containing protein [Pyrinomonadaceae bacterium]